DIPLIPRIILPSHMDRKIICENLNTPTMFRKCIQISIIDVIQVSELRGKLAM
ncbi:4971_t:CDS:2, partial [Dentiscutata erythropus]